MLSYFQQINWVYLTLISITIYYVLLHEHLLAVKKLEKSL